MEKQVWWLLLQDVRYFTKFKTKMKIFVCVHGEALRSPSNIGGKLCKMHIFCCRCLTLRVIIYNGNIIIQSSEMALLKKALAAGFAEGEGSALRSARKSERMRRTGEKNGCIPISLFNCISRYSFRFVTDFIALQWALSSQTQLI